MCAKLSSGSGFFRPLLSRQEGPEEPIPLKSGNGSYTSDLGSLFLNKTCDCARIAFS